MVSKIISKVFGSRNERLVKRMRKSAAQVTALEPQFEALSDEHQKVLLDTARRAHAALNKSIRRDDDRAYHREAARLFNHHAG